MLILTTDSEAGREVQYLGTVYAASCLSRWIGKDIMANFRNWTIGGELKTYSDMMDKGVALVLKRLQEQARAVGADAIYGLRFSTTSIAPGAAEFIGYGTAVKYMDRQSAPKD